MYGGRREGIGALALCFPLLGTKLESLPNALEGGLEMERRCWLDLKRKKKRMPRDNVPKTSRINNYVLNLFF